MPKAELFFRTPAFPWAQGAGGEAAAAGGADVFEDGVNAMGAVGAFIGADAGIGGQRGQIDVAEFSIGSEFKHVGSLFWGRGPDQNSTPGPPIRSSQAIRRGARRLRWCSSAGVGRVGVRLPLTSAASNWAGVSCASFAVSALTPLAWWLRSLEKAAKAGSGQSLRADVRAQDMIRMALVWPLGLSVTGPTTKDKSCRTGSSRVWAGTLQFARAAAARKRTGFKGVVLIVRIGILIAMSVVLSKLWVGIAQSRVCGVGRARRDVWSRWFGARGVYKSGLGMFYP